MAAVLLGSDSLLLCGPDGAYLGLYVETPDVSAPPRAGITAAPIGRGGFGSAARDLEYAVPLRDAEFEVPQ